MRAPLRFRVARRLLRVLLGLVFRVTVEGLGRLPADGPYLLACNHLSWVDPFILIGWLPHSPRLHFLGRRSAVYNRAFKRWVLRFVGGVIPVETGNLEGLNAAAGEVLSRKGVVAIFPEGGVGPAEGRLQPLRRGVAYFSVHSRAPVVVAGLAGTKELWRGKEIRVRIGQTLSPDAAGSQDELLEDLGLALSEAIPPITEYHGPRPWPWLTDLLR